MTKLGGKKIIYKTHFIFFFTQRMWTYGYQSLHILTCSMWESVTSLSFVASSWSGWKLGNHFFLKEITILSFPIYFHALDHHAHAHITWGGSQLVLTPSPQLLPPYTSLHPTCSSQLITLQNRCQEQSKDLQACGIKREGDEIGVGGHGGVVVIEEGGRMNWGGETR